MRNFFAFVMIAVAIMFAFVACEKNDNNKTDNSAVVDDDNTVIDDDNMIDDNDNANHSVTYNGMAMKGPFYAGGNVTVFACDENGIQTGEAYTSHIENSTGNFTLDAEVSGTVIVKAEGPYFNEIYNESSTGTVRVEAVFNATGAGTQNAFLNPISHIISYCKLKKIQSGDADGVAEIACATILFDELGLPKPDPFTVETLRDIQYPYPIAFSCGISQAAKLIAQGDKSKFDTELQRILDQAKIELATGSLSEGTKIIFRNGFATLDAEVCRSNLQTYLDTETEGIIIPPLGEALDTDGDSIPDSIDPDIDEDGVENEFDCVIGKTSYTSANVLMDKLCVRKTDNSWKCFEHQNPDYFLTFETSANVTINWNNPFTKVANGINHLCGIDDNQKLWSWSSWETPIKVDDTTWKDVFAGQNRTCAIDTSNQLFCWQDDLAIAGTKINDDTDWSSLSLGNDKFYAVKNDGTLWSWNFGENPDPVGTDLWKFISNTSPYAIKSDGTLQYISDILSPIPVGTDNDWEAVYGTCAVKTDNTLWCWNDGDKTPATKIDPVGWSCGEWNTISHHYHEIEGELLCGLKTDGSLWCLKDGNLIHIENLPLE